MEASLKFKMPLRPKQRYTLTKGTLGICLHNTIERMPGNRTSRSLDASLPTKNASNPRVKKTPKSSPFAHEFGRGIKGKRTTKGSSIHPHQNPKRKAPKSLQENHQKRLRKSPKRRNEKDTPSPKEQRESSIHTKEVHRRSSLLPNHPSLSQDLTMKLSS
jgi:hypothetical protein